MFLLFTQDKIANKIASILWVNHTAFGTTYPPLEDGFEPRTVLVF